MADDPIKGTVKIDTSEVSPPSPDGGDTFPGVLMETEPFRPHTGDYDIIDALTGLRWAFESIEEEKTGVETAHKDAGVPLAGNAPNHLDEISEAVQSGLQGLDQFEATSLFAVLVERARQNQKWGGPSHDDQHIMEDWLSFIERRLNVLELVSLTCDDAGVYHGNAEIDDGLTLTLDASPGHVRKLFVEIAALALAALESHDRLMGVKPDATDTGTDRAQEDRRPDAESREGHGGNGEGE